MKLYIDTKLPMSTKPKKNNNASWRLAQWEAIARNSPPNVKRFGWKFF